jgi:hypothetical protein
MKTNPASKAYPKVAKNTTTGSGTSQYRSVQAQQGIKDVNVAQGPRTGNMNPGGKRADFQDRKAEAAPLASMIQNAYKARTAGDFVDPRYESIESTVPPRKFKR